MGKVQEWAGVYPLFHWSFIPWGFYLVLAVAFGFMLHVRKQNRQKYSEACRPILGKHTDGWPGRIIDLLAVFALLAGTATTFSVATPLMGSLIWDLFHVEIGRVDVYKRQSSGWISPAAGSTAVRGWASRWCGRLPSSTAAPSG